MGKFRKYLSIVIAIIFIIIIIPNFVNLNSYKDQIYAKFYENTGYYLNIKNDIKLFFLPNIHLQIKDIELSKNILDKEPIVKVNSVEASIDLISLLKRNIGIHNLSKVTISNGEINYKTNGNKLIKLFDVNINAKLKHYNSYINFSFKNNDVSVKANSKIENINNLLKNKQSNFSLNLVLDKQSYIKILNTQLEGSFNDNKIISEVIIDSANLLELIKHDIYTENKTFFSNINLTIDKNKDNKLKKQSFDFDLNIKAKNLDLYQLNIDRINSRVLSKDDNLNIIFDQIAIAEGEAHGVLEKNYLNNYHIKLDAKDISLDKLNDKFKLLYFPKGNVAFKINLDSFGNDRNQLVSNLKGNCLINIKSGQIGSLSNEFKQIFKIIAEKDIDRLIFDQIDANFSINNGVMNSDNLTIKSDLTNIIGKGIINLNNNNVKFKITPLNIGNYNNDNSISLDVGGKFDNLRYAISTDQNLVDQVLKHINKKNLKLKDLIDKNIGKTLNLIK